MMKRTTLSLLLGVTLLLVLACEPDHEMQIDNEESWSSRRALAGAADSLPYGKTYLSVYSQMYSSTQKQKYSLTEMVSMRNVSDTDTIYFLSAAYFDTRGTRIRTYFDYPIYVLPLETLEIVIAQMDIRGGTGSNFMFEWRVPEGSPEPLFEAVMNSMQGTQGISFTTRGVRVE
jgi:hypothetical protein